MKNTIEKPHSIFPEDLVPVKYDQLMLPTWFLIVFLIVGFIILKSFIYIKDDKRAGK